MNNAFEFCSLFIQHWEWWWRVSQSEIQITFLILLVLNFLKQTILWVCNIHFLPIFQEILKLVLLYSTTTFKLIKKLFEMFSILSEEFTIRNIIAIWHFWHHLYVRARTFWTTFIKVTPFITFTECRSLYIQLL